MTSETAERPEAHPAIEVNSRARFEILGAIMLALFLGALDQTIVGPVLPKISTELKGADFYTWVVTAYLVTSTAAIPISLAVIGDLFTPAERGKYQGLFGAVFGVAFLVGPFLGGVLTDNISWHWIFFVNVPVGLISLYLIGRLLPMVHPSDAKFSLDILGVATFVGAIVPVLVALTLAENGNWGDPFVLGWFLVGFVFLGVFVPV